MIKKYTFCFLFFICICFSGCSSLKKTVLLSDRHVCSYLPVKEYCNSNGCKSLVLFDFHNDVNYYQKEITSFNWVGKLIEEEILDNVIWICSYSISDDEKRDKKDWLETNCSGKPEIMKNKILDTFKIVGFTDFLQMDFDEDYVVSVDLDLFTLDEKSDSNFVKKTCEWISKCGSSLVTVCFSASYQNSAEKSFSVLNDFITNSSFSADWFLLSNDFKEYNESREDLYAWDYKEEHPEMFYCFGKEMYRGAYFWMFVPREISSGLILKKIGAYREDKLSAEIINKWKDKDYEQFCSNFKDEKFDEYKKVFYESLKKECSESESSLLNSSKEKYVALRNKIEENEYKDYGVSVNVIKKGFVLYYDCIPFGISEDEIKNYFELCGSLLSEKIDITKDDLSEVFITFSVFSNYSKLNNWFDYVPGFHSIIFENDGEIKVYSGEFSARHDFSKDEFIQHICNENYLTAFSIKNKMYNFYKCDCVFYTVPLIH